MSTKVTHIDSFKTKQSLSVGNKTFSYYSLKIAEDAGIGPIHQLPFSLKVLLENLLRSEDGVAVTKNDIKALARWAEQAPKSHDIAYHPARVLMQDFTGVPAVVDLAALRDAAKTLGKDPNIINPLVPVDLVIDHSVSVDRYASRDAFEKNVLLEMQRNYERYAFLRWGQKTFKNFRIVPPGTGICHQVNLEYLAKTIWSTEIDGEYYAYPDTLVGTDSHTTMINGLSVLGWGVGGIEAEAVMLGQPISMQIPDVIGFKMVGQLKEGVTATDLVLTVTQMLRAKGVVAKFVEFYGDGLEHLSLPDRATISNMSPEYGATCGFFPIDQETLAYLELTNRDAETIELVEKYAKAQGLWRESGMEDPVFTDTLTLDLSTVEASLAGPKRPQDRVALPRLPEAYKEALASHKKLDEADKTVEVDNENFTMNHGDVVIAAITSCTNTSNPHVLMAAGLLAKNALAKGLKVKPWVKTSLAPGSKVVTDYLKQAGLQDCLDELGFTLVGYGCTTCIGNSGPLDEPIEKAIKDHDLAVSGVLSGNRNFEGRIHPLVKMNWLASPPLVVAYALAGSVNKNLMKDPLGVDQNGQDVYLKDIWPTNKEIAAEVAKVTQTMFRKEYSEVFAGDESWNKIPVTESATYDWDNQSTYIQLPPFFEDLKPAVEKIEPIKGARILALLGDSVTTDHISPAGAIKTDSPAGDYLKSHSVDPLNFNSYGSRRGNHEVMMRGTFANIRICNEMLNDVEGGFTKYVETGQQMSIYDAAMKYQSQQIPLVIIAGKEYGTGSSRDWAAKGTLLLGVKAVIAESFERIHRSNLIGMGVLPLQFKFGMTRKSLGLNGKEKMDIVSLNDKLKPKMDMLCRITREDGSTEEAVFTCRIDTQNEMEYFRHGGILQYVLSRLCQASI